MALAVLIAGLVVHTIGYFWLVVLAYREAPSAGRAALFIWPLAFLVPLLRWDEIVLKALVVAAVGLAMAWGGNHFMPEEKASPASESFSLPK